MLSTVTTVWLYVLAHTQHECTEPTHRYTLFRDINNHNWTHYYVVRSVTISNGGHMSRTYATSYIACRTFWYVINSGLSFAILCFNCRSRMADTCLVHIVRRTLRVGHSGLSFAIICFECRSRMARTRLVHFMSHIVRRTLYSWHLLSYKVVFHSRYNY